MSTVNKMIILGRLGSKPELRKTDSGTSVTTLNVATDDSFTDSTGQRQQRTDWHRVVVWGRNAENTCQYLDKGDSVYVEGPLRINEWTDQDGNQRQTPEVTALNITFLGGRSSRQEGYSPQERSPQPSF